MEARETGTRLLRRVTTWIAVGSVAAVGLFGAIGWATIPGADKTALNNLSFTVKAGETLAVVGRNGAGKTTLFKLICRLYDPIEGRILIDGIDVRDFEPDELREQIGAMFQDYVDYQATASENIGLGNVPQITDREAIVDASRQGGADELIAALPDGYDTALGKWFDAGVNLSGGEWQKVALARAFMRDAHILVLDEPTSALDAQAEHEVFTHFRSLTEGKTAVFISHRFSTVRLADRIFVIFQRLHERSAYPGTGIGLAMTRKIVEYFGGRIWLDPAFAGGARFLFTLPMPPETLTQLAAGTLTSDPQEEATDAREREP